MSPEQTVLVVAAGGTPVWVYVTTAITALLGVVVAWRRK